MSRKTFLVLTQTLFNVFLLRLDLIVAPALQLQTYLLTYIHTYICFRIFSPPTLISDSFLFYFIMCTTPLALVKYRLTYFATPFGGWRLRELVDAYLVNLQLLLSLAAFLFDFLSTSLQKTCVHTCLFLLLLLGIAR